MNTTIVRTEKVTMRGYTYDVFVGSNGVVLVGRNGKVKGGYNKDVNDVFGRLRVEEAKVVAAVLQ